MTGAGSSGPTETRRGPRESADPERTRRAVDRARRAAKRDAEADAHLAEQQTDVHRPVSGRPAPDQPLRARWDPTDEPGRARSERPKERKKQSAVGRFVTTYGWRAYAIPVLVVLTIVMIVLTVQSHQDGNGGEATHSEPDAVRNTNVRDQTTAIGAPTGPVQVEQLPAGVLPAGGPFTEKGAAGYHVVPGVSERVGTGGQEYTYTVEVENGLAPNDFGGDPTFAKLVETTLANPKSWIGGGNVSFRRIDNGEPDFRVTLTSPDTTRQLCGYEIKLESSCYYPPESRVTLNEARWVRGATSYQGDDLGYRQYLINHEIGHAIGFEAHEPCKANGALAPIMMQQTFGTANSEIMALDPDMKANRSFVCNPNPWPFPDR